jgi:hypothetical protein
MPVPQEISELIARFERNREAHLSGDYNETQLRLEFLNPFFAALGWDVENKQGFAEAYKDVVHEDAIKIGGGTKAPDYCFRIGGARKFFVEAKKPAINLNEDAGPAFQLRRYAWSAKLPLSILTNFAEFAVYDCREKPSQSDKASAGRTLYLRYSDYETRWEEISTIFSKEAVLKGSFDKYAETQKAKKGTAAVDQAFLKEIEAWREMLARNIALRNPQLTQREMNFVVQRTIDRIVFLRIGEDRGIETYGALLALSNGEHIYKRLCELFYRADERYNSELFHFQKEKGRSEAPDKLALELELDDKPLKDLINNLYYPDSPYEFSVLPADILGQVYEQFLGKVIRLTAGHRAVVEDKPEVKKAGGVYYTPTYIVDYIVKNTVGNLLEGKTPRQATKLRILDPACGSGSFLIGAYQYLLDWHRDWYVQDGAEKWARGRSPALHQTAGGDWRLTTVERKQILLNNIYGVDIDPQAVEVTKLSLLLKVLEGENEQTISRQLKFFHERALPDLGNNIKCGNSLIGPDFYAQQQMQLPDDEDRYRLNVFDWQAEFPEIMKAGGFDAVIGNPPYVRMEGFKEIKAYLKALYASHDERSDLYAYFIERAHKLLNRKSRFGMIVSNKFLRANYGEPLREFLRRYATIERVVDFAGLPVFPEATVRTIVLITSRRKNGQYQALYSPPLPVDKFGEVVSGALPVDEAISGLTYKVAANAFEQPAWSFSKPEEENLFRRLSSNYMKLAEYCDGQICMGVKSGLMEAFVIDEKTKMRLLRRNRKAEAMIKPFLNGRDVRRYYLDYKNLYLIYAHHGVEIEKYPAIEQHLRAFKDRLQKRATRQKWYELQQPQYNFARFMDTPKIIFPDIATTPRFAWDESGFYGANTIYFIPRHDLYLLGLLNSNLGNFYFAKTCAGLEGKTETYLRFFGQYLEGFPVRPINFSDPADKSRHDRMVKLVEQMLALNQKLAAAKTGHEQTTLQRQIDATDQQIDALVYELYGVNEDEIRIMEGQA